MNMKYQLAEQLFAGLSQLSADELDSRGEKGETLLVQNYPYREDLELPVLQGGWMCRFAGTKQPNETGSIVLLPNTIWTRKLWTKGQTVIAERAKLKGEQITRWINSENWLKHTLLPILSEIITDQNKVKWFEDFDINFSSDDYYRWSSRSGIILNFSRYQRRHLVMLFDEVFKGIIPKKQPRKKDKVKGEENVETTSNDVVVQTPLETETLAAPSGQAIASSLFHFNAEVKDGVLTSPMAVTLHYHHNNEEGFLSSMEKELTIAFNRLDKGENAFVSIHFANGTSYTFETTEDIRKHNEVTISEEVEGKHFVVSVVVVEDQTLVATILVS